MLQGRLGVTLFSCYTRRPKQGYWGVDALPALLRAAFAAAAPLPAAEVVFLGGGVVSFPVVGAAPLALLFALALAGAKAVSVAIADSSSGSEGLLRDIESESVEGVAVDDDSVRFRDRSKGGITRSGRTSMEDAFGWTLGFNNGEADELINSRASPLPLGHFLPCAFTGDSKGSIGITGLSRGASTNGFKSGPGPSFTNDRCASDDGDPLKVRGQRISRDPSTSPDSWSSVTIRSWAGTALPSSVDISVAVSASASATVSKGVSADVHPAFLISPGMSSDDDSE